jgi:hypothetical protein
MLGNSSLWYSYDDDWGMVPIKFLSFATKRSETHEKTKDNGTLFFFFFLFFFKREREHAHVHVLGRAPWKGGEGESEMVDKNQWFFFFSILFVFCLHTQWFFLFLGILNLDVKLNRWNYLASYYGIMIWLWSIWNNIL